VRVFSEPRGLFAEACFLFADHRAVALADTAFAAMADDNPLAALGNRVRRPGSPTRPAPAARGRAPSRARCRCRRASAAGGSRPAWEAGVQAQPRAALPTRRPRPTHPAPLAQIAGVDGKLGSPLGRLLFSGGTRSELGRAWVRDILRWDFDTVCCGHLTPSVPDGKRQVERCFSYLLQAGGA
jgi:hypothetical protein